MNMQEKGLKFKNQFYRNDVSGILDLDRQQKVEDAKENQLTRWICAVLRIRIRRDQHHFGSRSRSASKSKF